MTFLKAFYGEEWNFQKMVKNPILSTNGIRLAHNFIDTSLGDSIGLLFSYSMAKRKQRDDSFNIHPLVHRWARSRLEPEEQKKKATEAFLIVSTAVNKGNRMVQDWDFKRHIIPHIVAVEGRMETVALLDEDLLTGADKLGNVLHKQAQCDKALERYERALAGSEKAMGMDHPGTLTTVHGMASVYRKQGLYDKALEWYERALSGREKALGADHPDTLSVVHNMASVFSKQGQYDKALERYERVLFGSENSPEINHQSTQNTIHRLVNLYKKTGQREKIESLRLRLPLPSGPISRTAIARRADVTSVEMLKRAFGNQTRENESGVEDGDDCETVVPKRRKRTE